MTYDVDRPFCHLTEMVGSNIGRDHQKWRETELQQPSRKRVTMRKKPRDRDGDRDETLNQIYGSRDHLYKEVGPWGLTHPSKLYLVGVNTPYVVLSLFLSLSKTGQSGATPERMS